ncbi:DUF4391 domain-containing protein [Bombiscardovia coagulans]|uniref:DUF4391 domain-containing protein n=1 Tax=Bombiscardovia coagulans TaxID=686666 RepID=A0A261EUC1_9BIFI|nr:DUF4391 domain-containing protein [Bombiscardovia coagulans]OZG50246.1 hypothetical protein BOCO_0763 [Bombiscardovia coagulans]
MTPVSCGTCTVHTLGLPVTTAIPAEKGTLPKQMFYAKRSISTKLKQRFTRDLDSAVMLALLRSANTGIADGERVKEILIIGLELTCQEVPSEVVDYIAQMRSSGIIFVCHRKADEEGKEYALATRRALPVKPGYLPQFRVYIGPWRTLEQTKLVLKGENLDEVWDNFNAQVIFDSTDGRDLDAQIARHAEIVGLVAEETKLSKDHARTKDPAQRNEIYTRLHKIRTRLRQMGALD